MGRTRSTWSRVLAAARVFPAVSVVAAGSWGCEAQGSGESVDGATSQPAPGAGTTLAPMDTVAVTPVDGQSPMTVPATGGSIPVVSHPATPDTAVSTPVPPVADEGPGLEPVSPTTEVACESAQSPPRAPLRRLTRFEYNNTVRDLLGVFSRPADALPGEEAGSGFGNDADALGVSRTLIDGYRIVAQQTASEVVVDAETARNLTGCDPVAADLECRDAFLGRYLTDAFRRPPDAEELAAYQTAFEQGMQLGGDFASGVRAVIERSLQAPQFLYRVELGEVVDESIALARPTGYEMATRLAYLIWSSMPDRELLDAAARGELDTDEGLLTAATRLLEDDKAKDSLRYFHGQLLGTSGLDYIERDAEYYPTFEPGMGALFRQETEHFLDYVLWEGEGDLKTVFTAPYTFVNERLAAFYGIPDVTGERFQQVPLDTTKRAGLFTQASILTATTPGSRTDPVVRGKWLYTKMLCGKVPDPPLDVPLLPEPTPGQSVRERLEQHRADDACRTCHALMDPIGLAFEHYDGVGLWRDTDNGAAIDDTGEIPVGDVAGPFEGVIEFGQKMAQSRDVRACYADRYLTYAYGRGLSSADDCSKARATADFEATEGNVKELILAVLRTDGFRLRELVVPAE